MVVSAGDDFSAFLTSTGRVFTCGGNLFGQLGRPSVKECCHTPEIVQVTVVVTSGAPFEMSQLDFFSPAQGLDSSAPLTFLACGASHVVVASSSLRSVFAWGANGSGQCVQPACPSIDSPAAVRFDALGTVFVSIL